MANGLLSDTRSAVALHGSVLRGLDWVVILAHYTRRHGALLGWKVALLLRQCVVASAVCVVVETMF